MGFFLKGGMVALNRILTMAHQGHIVLSDFACGGVFFGFGEGLPLGSARKHQFPVIFTSVWGGSVCAGSVWFGVVQCGSAAKEKGKFCGAHQRMLLLKPQTQHSVFPQPPPLTCRV